MAKRKGASRRGPSAKTKIFMGILTALNLVLTLAVSIQRRREVLKAVAEDDTVRLLVTQQSDFTKPAK